MASLNDFMEMVNSPDRTTIEPLTESFYVAAGLFFILSLKGLGHQTTAKKGNLFGILGMLCGIFSTYASMYVFGNAYWIFFVVLVPCAIIAVVISLRIKMTSMPQMVGLLNAFGGLAAALEGVALYFSEYEQALWDAFTATSTQTTNFLEWQAFKIIFLTLSVGIGLITFTGSLIACGKLGDFIQSKPVMPSNRFFRVLINLLLIAGIIASGAVVCVYGMSTPLEGIIAMVVLLFLSAIYGFVFVLAIGGADMPVVISVLNSGSGWSGVFAGLMLNNSLMVISGAFVGASGIILSYVMCKAMNRSLQNVLVGGFGESATEAKFAGEPVIAQPEEVMKALCEAKSVMIVPGYGMAVSHAQFAVCDFTNELRNRGCKVRFGVHPVAGRLPGHMNVLLAEANVPYDLVFSLDEINDDFPNVDVSLVIGANDTVNPAAMIEGSAIYGMPVLQVWKGKQTFVLKRSMKAGYAGVDNPLFVYENTGMLLGDAKTSMTDLVSRLRSVSLPKGAAGGALDGGYSVSQDSTNVKFDIEKTTTPSDVSLDNGGANGHSQMMLGEEIDYFSSAQLLVGVLNERREKLSSAGGSGISAATPADSTRKYDENRVSILPDMVKALAEKLKIGLLVEEGAGIGAGADDSDYMAAGARVVSREVIFSEADVLCKVTAPTIEEVRLMVRPTEQTFVCGFVSPNSKSPEVTSLLEEVQARNTTLLSLDILPRITTAQKMDVLSSMAVVSGSRAVMEAFYYYGKNIGAQITAAGKCPQCKVLVIGAGVAGLQAVGDAHRMGAEVRGFDIRLECKDQVESMGGKYLVMQFEQDGSGEGGYAKPMSEEFIKKEMELFEIQAKECDIFITTAAIPGRPAPKLLKRYHADLMKKGSVIVDVAALSGGNVEITKPGENYLYNNKVTVIGYTDLASRNAPQSSILFSGNVFNLFSHMGGGENFNVDMEDDIIRSITVVKSGTLTYPPPRVIGPPPPPKTTPAGERISSDSLSKKQSKKQSVFTAKMFGLFSLVDVLLVILVLGFAAIFGTVAPDSFTMLVFLFVLACWVGYLLVWNVTPALHTPLMSVSNAISGVVLLGGMYGISDFYTSLYAEYCRNSEFSGYHCTGHGLLSVVLNYIAIGIAGMNVFGGFAVTQRMLQMFRTA